MLRIRTYASTVGRPVLVALGVLAAISAITLVVIGILALVHSFHHSGRAPVVTVTTTR